MQSYWQIVGVTTFQYKSNSTLELQDMHVPKSNSTMQWESTMFLYLLIESTITLPSILPANQMFATHKLKPTSQVADTTTTQPTYSDILITTGFQSILIPKTFQNVSDRSIPFPINTVLCLYLWLPMYIDCLYQPSKKRTNGWPNLYNQHRSWESGKHLGELYNSSGYGDDCQTAPWHCSQFHLEELLQNTICKVGAPLAKLWRTGVFSQNFPLAF